MIDIGLGSAAAKLTDKILGYNNDNVVDIMSDIATEYGLAHIAHVRLSSKNCHQEVGERADNSEAASWRPPGGTLVKSLSTRTASAGRGGRVVRAYA